jgi:6,7-dimethyl-8-ribityllumazine synthase
MTMRRHIAIVVSRFNRAVTDNLLEGAVAAAKERGVEIADTDVFPVPGAFELPVVARAIAKGGRYDAVVCLGAVVRGETPHFEFVCEQAAAGIQQVALETGVPVAFGVLTTDTMDQAMARAGGDVGNKGREALVTVLETLHQVRRAAGGAS